MPLDQFSIMVVDDTDVNIDILVDILGDDYDVRAALDGPAALDDIAQYPPDLVLLDIMMPGMDGYEVCKRLKADPKTCHIPVIFITAMGETKDELKGFRIGAVDYITKPVSPPVVMARVATHLALARARQDLARQNRLLKENVRLREEVDRISRHDLKTPLAKIISLPGLMRKAPGFPQKFVSDLKTIEESGYTMLKMINLSLDLFKMEQGTYCLAPEPVDLLELARRICNDLAPQARAKGVGFHISADSPASAPQGPLMASGEALLCYTMAANLIKNAVEACPQKTEVGIELARTGAQTCAFRIRNPGEVPRDIQKTFFDKYTTSGKSGGTGLGTYSARLMARVQGGDIFMSTDPVTGTRVTITLPLAIDRAAKHPVPDTDLVPDLTSGALPRLHLLIVDDGPDNLNILAAHLAHPDLTVDRAENGEQAIEKWTQTPYDLIFMDMEMPVMNGMAALGRIRAMESGKILENGPVPVIALSAHGPEAASACLEAGFTAYLTKPVLPADLYGQIRGLVHSRHRQPNSPEKGLSAPNPTGQYPEEAVVVDKDLKALIPMFLKNKKAQICQLPDLMDAGDFQGVKQLAHKLKGGFNMYGMTGLGNICADLEQAALSQDPAGIRDHSQTLENRFNQMKITFH